MNPEKENDIRQIFLKNKTRGTYDLAMYLVHSYDMITIGKKYRETFVYQDGIYTSAENLVIFPEIQRILGDLITASAKNETFHKIQNATSRPDNVFDLAPTNFIPLTNGVYDINTKELLPHDSKYHFKYKFPVLYDDKAECPKISAFLDQVLTTDQRLTMEEWMGYYFFRNYQFKKALIMVGEGDTGKTTLLEVIDFLLGKDNISSVSLHKMTADKFAAAHLYEKHGNIVDELSAKDITDTGNFKIATGGGSISGEYKFGNQFSFINFSKFTFACNKIPDVQDFDDEAYFNRWMVIRFEKTIEKKIPNFIATLRSEEERSGLFNIAMIGLERLLKNGKFSYGMTATDTKLEMMRNGSSIARFAQDKIQKDPGAVVTNDEIYKAYVQFCFDNDIEEETQTALSNKIQLYVANIIKAQVLGTGGVYVRGWRNVSIKLSDEQIEDKRQNDEWMENVSDGIAKRAEVIIKAS
jgi:P4 family phage/plasmid primase-like protien